MIVITGGAGFIGSAVVWALNGRGQTDLLLVDDVDHVEKEHNLAPLKYDRLLTIADFRRQLLSGDLNGSGVAALLHLGACSDTMEDDEAYLLANNVEYSQDIIRWCVDRTVRCVYASSAATYGSGNQGFSDNHELFDQLAPRNVYGRAKLLVDIWARDGGYLDQVVGLRYFNVFGPNEWHKGRMQSVIAKKFPDVRDKGYLELFASQHPDFADGEQDRDFMYVKDAVAVTLWCLDHREVKGVFNVGTGQARAWNDVARALFAALAKEPDIRYIDLPASLAKQYQYHTEADIAKLRSAGLQSAFMGLEESITDYVQQYLVPHRHLGGGG